MKLERQLVWHYPSFFLKPRLVNVHFLQVARDFGMILLETLGA